MIEIAFTESASGGLKLAQSFGKGTYSSGCIGVVIHHEDGSAPTQAEIEEAQRRAEEQQRKRWENAVPLNGRAGDVYNFALGLSFGDIRCPLCAEDRMNASMVLYSFWNEQIAEDQRKHIKEVTERLSELKIRIAAGEDARIWYSDTPDELCGFYWLMDELRHLPKNHGTIYALKQPELDEKDDVIITYNGWGEVEPGAYGRFIHLAVPVSDQLRRYYANQWRGLQKENSLIRACINGSLRSAPEDLYDPYIRWEIDAQPEEFKEAMVVGNVLGKYQPRISDGYIHHRIDQMVRDGKLIAVTAPEEDEPGYWRILRKNQ
ncbi:MAG: DUF1835 domain-containing protein [Oscillospiraceae bacterium]|nr:DUF1835 domain-containing protein [Oscillospiraceae bacterium]